MPLATVPETLEEISFEIVPEALNELLLDVDIASVALYDPELVFEEDNPEDTLVSDVRELFKDVEVPDNDPDKETDALVESDEPG